LIEVKLPRCLVVLTEAELLSLLAHDRDLWARGLERGKAVLRARAREAREAARRRPLGAARSERDRETYVDGCRSPLVSRPGAQEEPLPRGSRSVEACGGVNPALWSAEAGCGTGRETERNGTERGTKKRDTGDGTRHRRMKRLQQNETVKR